MEQSNTFNKTKLDLDYNYGFSINNVKLDIKEKISYNLYNWKVNNLYQIYNTRVEADIKYDFSDKLSLKSKWFWKSIKTIGQPLLIKDEVKEDYIIGSDLNFSFETDTVQSSWDLNLRGEYSLLHQQWEEIKTEIKRNYDCYSLNFNYDLIDDIISVGINF
jgi:CRISPR/Cas system-associated exonuclease Cas4 (RecB family)